MKKLIYSIIGLVMFASCEEDYKTDITIPMSGIYLNSPAEGVIMDLNDESKDSYEFTWDKASEHGSVLIFSTTKDLVKQVTIETGTGTSCSISALTINQLLSKLDIKSGNERLIYWTVKDKNNQTAAASEVRTLQARRMKSVLLTPEDMATATLLADATQTKIKFEWDASVIDKDTECTVLLSLNPAMDNFRQKEQEVFRLPMKKWNKQSKNYLSNVTGPIRSIGMSVTIQTSHSFLVLPIHCTQTI